MRYGGRDVFLLSMKRTMFIKTCEIRVRFVRGMRKKVGGNTKPNKKDLEIELITDYFLVGEHLIHKRQS